MNLFFNYFEKKTFETSGAFFKKFLEYGNKSQLDFTYLLNEFNRELNTKIVQLISSEDKELYDLLQLFNSRAGIYKSEPEKNIIDNQLLHQYKKSSLQKKISFKEVIYKLALHSGLTKSKSVITHKRFFYEMLYDKNLLDYFIYTADINTINKTEDSIRKKLSNSSIGNTIDLNEVERLEIASAEKADEKKNESNIILLYGIRFNLYEFALYQREWRDFACPNTPFREIYDKVKMDFQDPFGYKRKRYDTTLFYKVLKEEFRDKVNYFDVCLAYKKILKLASNTNNKKFKTHLKERYGKIYFKGFCK